VSNVIIIIARYTIYIYIYTRYTQQVKKEIREGGGAFKQQQESPQTNKHQGADPEKPTRYKTIARQKMKYP